MLSCAGRVVCPPRDWCLLPQDKRKAEKKYTARRTRAVPVRGCCTRAAAPSVPVPHFHVNDTVTRCLSRWSPQSGGRKRHHDDYNRGGCPRLPKHTKGPRLYGRKWGGGGPLDEERSSSTPRAALVPQGRSARGFRRPACDARCGTAGVALRASHVTLARPRARPRRSHAASPNKGAARRAMPRQARPWTVQRLCRNESMARCERLLPAPPRFWVTCRERKSGAARAWAAARRPCPPGAARERPHIGQHEVQ